MNKAGDRSPRSALCSKSRDQAQDVVFGMPGRQADSQPSRALGYRWRPDGRYEQSLPPQSSRELQGGPRLTNEDRDNLRAGIALRIADILELFTEKCRQALQPLPWLLFLPHD